MPSRTLKQKSVQAANRCNARALEYNANALKVTGRQVREAWERDKYVCVVCQKQIDPVSSDLTIEHRELLSEGGANSVENLCTTCLSCNSRGGRTGNAALVKVTRTQERVIEELANPANPTITAVAEKAGVTRETVDLVKQNPTLTSLVEREKERVADKQKGILGISKKGLDKAVRVLKAHLDTLEDTGALSPGQLDDLLRVVQTFGAVVKLGTEAGLEDQSDEITLEEKQEAHDMLRRRFIRGMRYATRHPEAAAAYLEAEKGQEARNEPVQSF